MGRISIIFGVFQLKENESFSEKLAIQSNVRSSLEMKGDISSRPSLRIRTRANSVKITALYCQLVEFDNTYYDY